MRKPSWVPCLAIGKSTKETTIQFLGVYSHYLNTSCHSRPLVQGLSPYKEVQMFDPEDLLTHEEMLLRFKKVLGRDMTAEEKHRFFLQPEFPPSPTTPTENSD